MSSSLDTSTRPVLVLQHADCEPPGAYEDELLARGIPLRRVLIEHEHDLPDWREHSAVIAMGGPMGAYEDALHPWLAAEKELIGEAVRGGCPYWGVCLGAQLLAAALGAGVAPGAQPELGVLEVQLTDSAAEDPVFAGAPARFLSLQWHGDTFTLPPGAVRLARSALYEQQAFVVGRAYGLQFHLEVTDTLAREWVQVPAYARELEELDGPDAPARLLAEMQQALPRSAPLARALFSRWLERVAGFPPLGRAGTASPPA